MEKAEALREVLKGPREPHRVPAQMLGPPTGELHWLVDREAAARLKMLKSGNPITTRSES